MPDERGHFPAYKVDTKVLGAVWMQFSYEKNITARMIINVFKMVTKTDANNEF